MLSLNTPIPPINSPKKISHDDHFIALGSCFAEHIGGKLLENKFNGLVNPLGVIFNPVAMARLLKATVHEIEESILEISPGVFVSFLCHSSVYGLSRASYLSKLLKEIEAVKKYLQQSNYLLLTLGTAFIYEHKDFGAVANCHKQASSLFTKNKNSPKELSEAIIEITSFAPQAYVCLSVSPVRHWKDGPIQNTRSKAALQMACEHLEAIDERYFYFPAWEILMDELRDYRFYKNDLLHPNSLAVTFVWNYFQQTFFDAKTQSLLKKWEKFRNAFRHRSLYPEAKAHYVFLQELLKKVENVDFPFDLDKEINELKAQIIKHPIHK